MGSRLGSLGAGPGTALTLQISHAHCVLCHPLGHCQGLSKAVCVQSVPAAFGGGWQSSAPSGSGQGLNNKCCPDPDAPLSLCQHGVGVVGGGKGVHSCPPGAGQDPGMGCARGCSPQGCLCWACRTLPGSCSSAVTVFHGGGTACGLWDVSDCPCTCAAGVGSFLLYSVHEGIRGIPLDPNDKSDALVPVSGTSLAVGIDFHAGEAGLGTGQGGWEQDRGWGA